MGDFPDGTGFGVYNSEECFTHCNSFSAQYFGITDSDGCANGGKQADCYCGMNLPADKLEGDQCLNCTDINGNEYHCGSCGWKLDVYRNAGI